MTRRLVLLLPLLSLIAGCGAGGSGAVGASPARSGGPLRVVATIGMVADIVRNVGGDAVEVHQMLGPGIDPHLYKPSRDDVQTLLDADAVFYSGLLLEGKMTDAFVKVGRTKPVYAVTELIDESSLLTIDEEGHPDPHVWMDVSAWSLGIDAVRDALTEMAPANAADFAVAAEAYRAELAELDAYAKEAIATVPQESRVLVTSHDAFGYLGRAYDFEVLGVQGFSTESEAGLRRVNELVDMLVERKIAAIFIESSVSPKNIRALIDGAAAKGHKVRIGGELFSDAMGAEGTYEGTYAGMIDHNITKITRALGGEAPELGRTGELAKEEAE